MKKESVFCLFKLLGWSVLLYLFIFQPVFSKYIYLGVELFLVMCFFLVRQSLFVDNFRLFRKEYIFIGLICGYALLMDCVHLEIVYLDRFIASFFQGYLVSLLLIYCISRSSFLQNNLSNCIFCVCFIACSITIAAILVPSIGQFCINHATIDGKERLQELYIDGGYTQYRSYGLSENLNFTYAYVLAIIGGYLLSTTLHYYTPFLIVMILVAIIFNARIAFVPLFISLLYLVFLKKKSLKGFASIVFVIMAVVILIGVGLSAFPELNNEWGLSFFMEISSLLTGEDSSTVGTLTGSMWVIPDNGFDLLFGTGKNLFVADNNNSDVGYILQLNYGGIMLLSIILFYFIYISKRIFRRLSSRHWFAIMFVASIFILNFKGFYLAAIPGNRFLTFLYVYYIYAARKGSYELSPKQTLL